MENQLMLSYASDEVTTELSIANTELENRSWNLFAILLAIGHPVPSIELASRCTSLGASPEFVEFVCSIPNSPISLTTDGLVTVSSSVCIGLQRFLSNSNRVWKILLPREVDTRDCGHKRALEDVDIRHYRKRRRLWPNVYEKADQTDLAMPVRIANACGKVYIHVDDDMVRSVIMNAGNSSVGISNDNRPDEVTVKMSSLIDFDARPINHGLNNYKYEGEREMGMYLSMKDLGSKNSFLYNDSYMCFPSPSTTISGGLKDYFPFQSSSHLTASSVVRIEDIKGEKCLLSKKRSTVSCQEDDNNKVISLVKAWIDNCSSMANNNPLERQRLMEGKESEHILDSASHRGNAENLSNNTVYGGMIPELNFGDRNTSCNNMTPCSGSGEKAFCQEVGEHNIVLPTDTEKLSIKEAQMDDLQEEEKAICGRGQLVYSQHGEGDPENLSMSMEMACKDDRKKNSIRSKHTSLAPELNLMTSSRELISLDQKHLPEFSTEMEVVPKDAKALTVQTVSITTNKGSDVGAHIEQKCGRKDKRSVSVRQKIKPTCDPKMDTIGKWERIKENKEKPTSIPVKDHSEPRVVPMFDSYIVEEEEGSGGYGTVYKTRRKKDGTTFAVKYPHVNANRHHVHNELKMLERFGGKNFVIKYEGSFKSGNSHCIVLEHVAHDRPEILKREIDVYQLRWYGYCLFRALASLHKQGVIHRDVKPGNFLFSRKAAKGYLIDFNLATDLHQKFGSTEKSKSPHAASFGLVPPPHPESLPPTKSRKYTSSKALEAVKHEAVTQSKSLLFQKNLKKKTDQVKGHKELNMQNVMKSQGADGSGITSTKDATSTRVPSAERFREPIPCRGRKELLNLVHEMQGPDHEATSTPTSKRKRVAAPPAKSDKKFIYLTPMPLQCAGVAVVGAGLLKNKGEGKQRKEGPCVGTKGFRAPEVLFKSTHQGPKVDVWSAGVTLLYLIIGRTPFVGDPDQNIKEIAKLRGSEDLWEVAKLHDRESSFPPELFQIQSLPSTELREWCKHNTRRPGFLEVVPRSLIDLVDKCLMVNPRSRISAEDALRHEFFMPCFKDIEKQRLRRQKLSLDTGTAESSAQPVTCEGLS